MLGYAVDVTNVCDQSHLGASAYVPTVVLTSVAEPISDSQAAALPPKSPALRHAEKPRTSPRGFFNGVPFRIPALAPATKACRTGRGRLVSNLRTSRRNTVARTGCPMTARGILSCPRALRPSAVSNTSEPEATQ